MPADSVSTDAVGDMVDNADARLVREAAEDVERTALALTVITAVREGRGEAVVLEDAERIDDALVDGVILCENATVRVIDGDPDTKEVGVIMIDALDT